MMNNSSPLATTSSAPRDAIGCVHLRSCPFHELAEQDRDLACTLSQRLVEGIVLGLGNETLGVVMEPATEECCVVLEPPRRLLTARSSPTRPTPTLPPWDGCSSPS